MVLSELIRFLFFFGFFLEHEVKIDPIMVDRAIELAEFFINFLLEKLIGFFFVKIE